LPVFPKLFLVLYPGKFNPVGIPETFLKPIEFSLKFLKQTKTKLLKGTKKKKGTLRSLI
jgi:hypothetical protein